MKFLSQTTKDKILIIFDILFAIYCLLNLNRLFGLFLIMIALTIYNCFLLKKHSKTEQVVGKFLNENLDIQKEASKKNKKEKDIKNQQYINFVNEIEDEFKIGEDDNE